MYISDRAWTRYIELLRNVNETAAKEMHKYLATHEWFVSPQAKRDAVDFAAALAEKYGEAASAAACEFYDIIATEWAAGVLPPAVPANTAKYGEVAKSMYGAMNYTDNIEYIASVVGRMVKMAGVDTTMQNAIRDGAEWAWIPHGETCAFCLTLASRGWQPASKAAMKNGHAEHIHSNCDCTYCVRFDRDSYVEGYNPDKYLRMYYDAPLDGQRATPKNRINAMRRQAYAQTGSEEIEV